ncbi:MAG: NUDIX hydrolase [Planctomycetota bacterium]|jgi:NADH pyrophosphatase NudC (nudix superfamily)
MKTFNYCPSCGSTDIFFDDVKKLRCAKCSFTYYHNVAAAVAAILEYEDKIVLIRRKKEPGRGKLDLPGGFMDPSETAEEALRREIKEELGINLGALKYIGSYPNIYVYKKVRYYTCDLFFHCRIDSIPTSVDKTEIEEFVLMSPSEIPDEEIAFESTKIGLGLFINTQNTM